MTEKTLNLESLKNKIRKGEIKTIKDLGKNIDLDIINKVNGKIIPELVFESKEFEEMINQNNNDAVKVINSQLPENCQLPEKNNMFLGNESVLRLENGQNNVNSNNVDSNNIDQILNYIRGKIDSMNGIME